MIATLSTPEIALAPRSSERRSLRLEMGCFVILLALINLPLLTGGSASSFAFHPDLVRQGEWWRLATHPFAHVTWYHLLLDAAAFLLAYAELGSRRGFERLGFVIAAGAGSLLVAWGFSPLVATNGLCGLSGIAHGLTAVAGFEMLRKEGDTGLRIAGLLCFLSVVGKSLIEAVTGHVLFASWHLGSLGTPVAVSHAGGVLGVLAAVGILAVLQNRRQPPAS
jgi:rhomboid family GlyGly-CTERM serine protease